MATHGWWCGSRTYPTTCRECGASVFFFSCDCGSAVFFDDLGWPWPEHFCRENHASREPLIVAKDYAKTVSDNFEKLPRRPVHQAVRRDPTNLISIVEIGILREVEAIVDLPAKCGVTRADSLGSAFLGDLASVEYGQITVHSGDLSKGDTQSYTAFIDRRLLLERLLTRGQLVRFRLNSKRVPTRKGGMGFAWFCTDLTLIG